MTKLSLSLAIERYDRTLPLADGRVEPAGIDLNVIFTRWEDTFWGMVRHQEWDIAEMSLSTLIIMHSEGVDDLLAIPVFPSRVFRHSSIYINVDAGIHEPSDLEGRRVGVSEYQITACMWTRAILQHQYGVLPTDIEWLNGGLVDSARKEKFPLKHLPSDLKLSYIEDGKNLNTMLLTGEVDAIISAVPPPAFVDRHPKVRRLFADVKGESVRYFKETGFFPPMHTVAMRRAVYETHPWVANSLMDAFTRAKEYARVENMFDGHLRYALPLLAEAIEEHYEMFGNVDMWPYGFDENRDVLEAMTVFSFEQGLSGRKVDPRELFAPTTLERPKR